MFQGVSRASSQSVGFQRSKFWDLYNVMCPHGMTEQPDFASSVRVTFYRTNTAADPS